MIKSKGFILLHALGVILITSALVISVSNYGLRTSNAFALEHLRIQRGLSSRSIIELIIYDLLVEGNKSKWMYPPAVSHNMTISGQTWHVTARNVEGLLSVEHGDRLLWQRLLAKSIPSPNENLADALMMSFLNNKVAIDEIDSYPGLQAKLGLSNNKFDCLYPHITLFSNYSEPRAITSTPLLRTLLGANGRKTEAESVIVSSKGVENSTWRIDVGLLTVPEKRVLPYLSVEVLFTGLLEPSYLVRSVNFFIGASNQTSCS